MNETCPVLTELITHWNTYLHDSDKDRTTRLVTPKLAGTKTTAAAESRRRYTILHWHFSTALPAWLELAGLSPEANTLREREPLAAQKAHEISPLLALLDTVNASLTAKVNKLDDGNPAAVSHSLRFAALDALGKSGDRAALRGALRPYLPYPHWLITNRTDTTGPHAAIAAVLQDYQANPTDTVLHSASKFLDPTVRTVQESLIHLLERMLQE